MGDAKDFFEVMLAERDETNELLASVNGDDEIEYIECFEIDLSSFLQNNSITYNQFFTTVFAYTLSRFTGSDKVLFNLIENGRGHINLSNSVGMFVKTLPILIDCKNQDIKSFIKYSSNLINSAMKYDLYPFRILANEYDLNSNITFQYNHNLFNTFNLDIEELKHDIINDLSFSIHNIGGNNFEIKVIYSSKYSKDFIKRFVESYILILKGMVIFNKLNELNYIDNHDLSILDSYNQTDYNLKYMDILNAFNDNLVKYPDNNLVSFNDVSYCYSEGAFIADKIAKKLVEFGIGPNDYVGFLVERSELYMFCILGILSVGGVYVPLDDNLPDERINFMLEDTASPVVIVSDKTYKRAMNLINDDIILFNISEIFNESIGRLYHLPIVYGDLASILYTSGSTGVPKGVKITRKSLINVCEDYIAKYGLNCDDVYALFSTIGFDMSSFVIAVVICAGACLAVIPENLRFNMVGLNDYFVSHNVSHAFITTQVGKLFMANVDESSLNLLLVAGEKLGDFTSPEDYRLVDAYGPTESFAFVSSIDVCEKLDYSSVGFVNSNVKFYVLDDDLRHVPIGAVGELYLFGEQIADGYLNRLEETKNAFVDNPFDEGIMYRTGDMVRVLPDGTIGFIGRKDTQVKIRGNRVELLEIESLIQEIGDIDDVSVQTIKNGNNNELIAYVVPSDEIGCDALRDIVCSYVSNSKPDYMVPSYVVRLDCIPLTVNGKVDKRALPEIDLDSLGVEYVAPTNDVEKAIVDAFEKVFNRKGIGILDDFVRLGGDSLTAIKLLTYLDDFNISVADVLSLHTPKAIAEIIKDDVFDLDVYTLEGGCPLNEPQLNVYLDVMANDKKDSEGSE